MIIHYVVLFFLLFQSALCVAKEQFIWLTDDPLDVTQLQHALPTSIGSHTSKLVLSKLTQYDIKVQVASIPRIDKLLVKYDNMCVANRVKTKKRMSENIFSLPLNLYMGLRLYHLDKLQPEFESDGTKINSLSRFLELNKGKTLGLAHGRSYGEFLDRELIKVPQNSIITRSGSDRYVALLNMFFKSRLDFIIEYPVQVKDHLKLFNNLPRTISYEIAETPQFILGYIACSKSKQGQVIIEDINQVLKNLYLTEEFYKAHTHYIHESDIAEFNIIYNQTFNR